MNMTGKAKSRKKRIIRKLVLFLVLILILAGTYDSYTATTGSISNSISFSGNLSLIDSATYTASSSGTVKTLYAAAGDEVEAGAKLVRLNNGETITSDFAGRVNKVNVNAGDEVAQGTEIVQVADFKHMKISFRVDEYDISDISVGDACTVTVTSLEKAFDTTIDAIDCISSSTGNVAYYTATAYVDVDDSRVLPGMQVTVSITQEETQDAVILKVDAVSFDATNQAYVWMKGESGELEQVYITTGVSNGNYIEITEGLSDGDEVYVESKETESTSTSLFGSLFGGQQFNQPQGGPNGGPNGGNWDGERGTGGERGNWNGERNSSGGTPGGQRPGN